MMQFFRENAAGLVGMLVLAVFWLFSSLHSIKNTLANIEKKRAGKNLPPFTDDELQIMKKEIKTSIIHYSIGALVAGIIAIIVSYLIVTAI